MTANPTKRVPQLVSVIALWLSILGFGYGSAAIAREEMKDLGEKMQVSRPSLTGAGARVDKLTAAKPGGADGLGNPMLGERRPLYRLRSSDVVEVTFTVAPEFNQTLTVQPDGYVMLKDAGAVEAQGLTVPEFREAVEKAYAGYLHDPDAAVALKDFERPYFVVGGQVGKPGKYELRSDITVAEAVAIAGGFTTDAKHSQIVLFRRVNNEDLMEARVLNLKKMLRQCSLREDAHLRAGDMNFVPQNTISKISRFVSRPSTLDELLTNAMIFVSPSDMEGLSLALLDAMGAGLCVLTTDVPENREAIEGAGFTFVRGDAADLAQRLQFLIANPAVREAAGERARKRIEMDYQWTKITEDIEHTYFQVLGRDSTAAPKKQTTRATAVGQGQTERRAS